MKLARDEGELVKAFAEYRWCSASAFGSDRLCIERRHQFEVHVLADHHGCAIHLFERECSVQHHQKVIEELLSVLMDRYEGLRASMTDMALARRRATGYRNAGTVEFIVDETGAFCFIEMNTCLPVEHPATEMVTGLDLVEMQLRIASGEPLPVEAHSARLDGHAIECLLYSETPDKGVLPSSGRNAGNLEPEFTGGRINSGVAEGWAVTPHHDALLATLVSHGSIRAQAVERLTTTVVSMVLDGLVHNGALHRAVLESAPFLGGDFHTCRLENWYRTACEAGKT